MIDLEPVHAASARMTKQKESILIAVLPDKLVALDLTRITCWLYPDGSEEYRYDGKPIVAFYPWETETVYGDDGTVTMRFNQRYRLLVEGAASFFEPG